MIEISNLTLGYNRHPVIHHLSLKIGRGDSVAVVGPNGCGKSSLLKGIMSFVKPMEGEIRCAAPREKIAYLPQSSTVDKTFPMTALEFAASGLFYKKGFFGGLDRGDYALVEGALERTGLRGMADEPLKALSGGQIQRALFARLIIQDADLIILDEPFNAIDVKTVAELLKIVKAWISAGRTVVSVLHDLRQVREVFALTAILSRELVAFGPTEEVLTRENLDKAFSNSFYPHKDANFCTK